MKPQFLTDETLVSHRRNFGIAETLTAKKVGFCALIPKFHRRETDLLRRKRLRDATVTAKLLSLCYHTLPSPHNNHIIIHLPPFM